MAAMNPEYIEKIYADWLAKVIGVRLGAPIEGYRCDGNRKSFHRNTEWL